LYDSHCVGAVEHNTEIADGIRKIFYRFGFASSSRTSRTSRRPTQVTTMSGQCQNNVGTMSEAVTFHITVLLHIEELSHIESCAFYCCFLSNQSQFPVMFKSFVQNAIHFHQFHLK
jgi:hypothetical protein